MKKRKDFVNVSMRIDRKIWEDLKVYADNKGQSYTVATERILRQFLDINNSFKENSNNTFNKL